MFHGAARCSRKTRYIDITLSSILEWESKHHGDINPYENGLMTISNVGNSPKDGVLLKRVPTVPVRGVRGVRQRWQSVPQSWPDDTCCCAKQSYTMFQAKGFPNHLINAHVVAMAHTSFWGFFSYILASTMLRNPFKLDWRKGKTLRVGFHGSTTNTNMEQVHTGHSRDCTKTGLDSNRPAS